MEPIVIQDVHLKRKAHIVVYAYENLEEIIENARLIFPHFFKGEGQVYFKDPANGEKILVKDSEKVTHFLDQKVDTFYWESKATNNFPFQAPKNLRKHYFQLAQQQQNKFNLPTPIASNGKNELVCNFDKRSIAAAIDFFIIIFAISMGIMFTGPLAFFITPWLYFALLESSSFQATVGKRLMGIKVSDMYGYRLNFKRASMRYFLKVLGMMIGGLGILMALITPKRQALHDAFTNSMVVNDTQQSQAQSFKVYI